jgi:hypothetical protein
MDEAHAVDEAQPLQDGAYKEGTATLAAKQQSSSMQPVACIGININSHAETHGIDEAQPVNALPVQSIDSARHEAAVTARISISISISSSRRDVSDEGQA